jgi:hypothetical protein
MNCWKNLDKQLPHQKSCLLSLLITTWQTRFGGADSLYMQRYGCPSLFATRPDFPISSREHELAQVRGGDQRDQRQLSQGFFADLPLPLGNLGHESSSAAPSGELPARFAAGQESASVLQLTKRPKLRAKDVIHRRSMTSAETKFIQSSQSPRFWNMDSSFPAPTPALSPDQPVVKLRDPLTGQVFRSNKLHYSSSFQRSGCLFGDSTFWSKGGHRLSHRRYDGTRTPCYGGRHCRGFPRADSPVCG